MVETFGREVTRNRATRTSDRDTGLSALGAFRSCSPSTPRTVRRAPLAPCEVGRAQGKAAYHRLRSRDRRPSRRECLLLPRSRSRTHTTGPTWIRLPSSQQRRPCPRSRSVPDDCGGDVFSGCTHGASAKGTEVKLRQIKSGASPQGRGGKPRWGVKTSLLRILGGPPDGGVREGLLQIMEGVCHRLSVRAFVSPHS